MRGAKVCCVLVALLSALVVPAEETSREVSADAASENGKDPAGLEVAARQPLFDYAGSIGLQLLEERLEDGDIHIPPVHKRVDVPVIGGVDVDVKDIKCKRVEIPENVTSIQIADGYYHLMSTEVYLEADFKWGWRKGPLSSSGSGELLLKNGVIDLLFTVGSSPGGHPVVRVGAVSVSFSDIDLHLQSKHLTWLYSVLLTLFHDQIAGAITDQINNSLEWDVPNLVNKILHTVPTNVKINNLPFAATFQYALYTQRFVLGEGFIDVSTMAPRPSASAAGGGKCPFHAKALALSNDAILKEGQMATLYLHQSVANCILWALFNAGRLDLSVKDGTIPSIRLITDLFVSLIPGIEKQYPRRPMRIDINATAPPLLVFDGKLRQEVFTVQYDSEVYVEDQPLLEGEAARGEDLARSGLLRGRGCRSAAGCAAQQLAAAEQRRLLSEEAGREAPAPAAGGAGGAPKEILVAHLRTNLTIAAQLSWDLTLIRSVDVQYQVVDSPFNVPVSAWDSTVKFVVETLGPQLGLKKLKEQYLNLPVVSDIRLVKPDVQVLDEWLGFSFDLRLHGNLSHPHPRPFAPLAAQ